MKIADLLAGVRAAGRSVLTEDEAKEVLSVTGVPVNPGRVAFSAGEAARAAGEVGFPAAVKIRSTVITHKTEAGGVRLGLKSKAQVRRAFQEIMARVRPLDPEAGVLVQPMAPPGVEVIIGMTADRQFGPVMAFGLGGTQVEVLDDICFRMAPLSESDALEMIRSVKGSALLRGYRGGPRANLESLAGILVRVSRLAQSQAGIAEIDLNPVSAGPGGAVVVDARMVIK